MLLKVAGFDPSLTHWGYAEATVNLATGDVYDLKIGIVETEKDNSARPNRDDLRRAEILAKGILPVAQRAKLIIAEIPIGSKSASAMKSYAFCIAHLAFLRSLGHSIIEVDPATVKELFTGNKQATKREMIDMAVSLFPNADWPRHGKQQRIKNDAEHMADAVAIINAGMQSPAFVKYLEQYAP